MAQEGTGGERTEKATPKKRKDARERGQVRKSQDVVTALMMLALFAVLRFMGPWMWERMAAFLSLGLTGQLNTGEVLYASDMPGLLTRAAVELGLTILPVIGVAFLIGMIGNVAQVGFLFSTKALQPKLDRLNPISGIKRLFSLHTLYSLAQSLVKVIIVGVVAYRQYVSAMESFSAMALMQPIEAVEMIWDIITGAALTICVAMLILAVIDFVYQWFKYEKDLRMTKYEVKMEYKQTEGDPQIKGKIKQKQRQMSMMRMMQSVPEADVVITNPTHYAVALKYDESRAAAPIVLAKGQDYVAQKIKETAREHGVEIVENKPVAQGLYAMCEIGSEVPFEMYQAVAEILAYVYKLRRSR